MDNIDLSKMSLDELQALQKNVTRALANYEERKRLEAIAALEAKAKEMGFSLAELTGATAKKKTPKALGVPKYAHPENPSVTWTGRGRQPAWIKEGLEAGRSLEDFLIAKV